MDPQRLAAQDMRGISVRINRDGEALDLFFADSTCCAACQQRHFRNDGRIAGSLQYMRHEQGYADILLFDRDRTVPEDHYMARYGTLRASLTREEPSPSLAPPKGRSDRMYAMLKEQAGAFVRKPHGRSPGADRRLFVPSQDRVTVNERLHERFLNHAATHHHLTIGKAKAAAQQSSSEEEDNTSAPKNAWQAPPRSPSGPLRPQDRAWELIGAISSSQLVALNCTAFQKAVRTCQNIVHYAESFAQYAATHVEQASDVMAEETTFEDLGTLIANAIQQDGMNRQASFDSRESDACPPSGSQRSFASNEREDDDY